MIHSERLALPWAVLNINPGHIGEVEALPIAVYTLIDVPNEQLSEFCAQLDDEPEAKFPGYLPLVKPAPEHIRQQHCLSDVLYRHVEYVNAFEDGDREVDYFPYAFAVICDQDWASNGVYIVGADWQEPHEVLGFRIRFEDAQEALIILLYDDRGLEALEELEDYFDFDERQGVGRR